MNETHRKFEIRCPVHGFIPFDDWERQIIGSPEFQRLRRIRQLAFTEFIYPGATHTRFEHSLGVMHVASRMYDSLTQRSEREFTELLGYDDAGFRRDRRLLRLAALLHDVGHGPLSHASEELMPESGPGKRVTHEEYSAAIVRSKLRNVIEDHALNGNYKLSADEVADFLEGKLKGVKRTAFWRDALDGQIDADRMDYLLRDSHHCGVRYGRFDLDRVIGTLTVVQEADGSPRIGVVEGGWHAAESLVLARYLMFTQVYFHKTRVAYDILLRSLLKRILPDGRFPGPAAIDRYLEWDDWKVLASATSDTEHGKMLRTRDHYRAVCWTPEVAGRADVEKFEKQRAALGNLIVAVETAGKSWYRLGGADIPVASSVLGVRPLSEHSTVVANMKGTNQQLAYTLGARAAEARGILRGLES